MASSSAPHPDLLLRHASFVRALARRLAADESAADDLVQDTWLAVLERPAVGVRSPRSWLAGVLSNLWRERRRSEDRRRQREAHAARPEAEPPIHDTLDAAAAGREIVSLVLDLEEPYRTVLLLRYYESLPPRAIAERLGIPVKTVDTRLARGLERLRASWRRAHGDDVRAWLGALLLVARPPHAASTSAALIPAPATASLANSLSVGVAVMSTKILWTAAVLLGCGALAVLWMQSPREDSRALAGTEARSGEKPGEHAPLAGPDEIIGAGAGEERRVSADDSRASGPATKTEASPALAPEHTTIRGRVLNDRALPMPGIEVVYRGAGAEVHARSAANGVFTLEAPRGRGTVTADDPALVTLYFGSVRAGSTVEPLVVVAPFRDLAGRTVDDANRALPGASVHFVLPSGFAARFDAVFDATDAHEWKAQSDAEGRFALERAPVVDEARLVADLGGYVESSIEAPSAANRDLEIVLARPAHENTDLRGRVEDPSGHAVARARVTLGASTTTCDAQGGFRLNRRDAGNALEIVALQRGFLPGRVRAEVDAVDGKPAWPDFVVVRLGQAPLAIAGRVVDKAGHPLPGLRVWIADPTPFGILRDDTKAQVEYLLASREAPDSDEELSESNWSARDTDEHGRFRLEGLMPRAYSVRMIDNKSCGAQTSGPFDASGAGADEIEIVFDPGPLRRVAGRILTHAGHAVENARIELMGEAHGGVWNNAGTSTTGADGRFAFEGVGRNRILLWIRGDDVVSKTHFVDESAPTSDLEIAVDVRCHFKIDCGAAVDLADAFEILDASGSRVDLVEVGASGETTGSSSGLHAGRSKTLAVTSEARTLVLTKQGAEVRRVPLDLVPGRLNLIQP